MREMEISADLPLATTEDQHIVLDSRIINTLTFYKFQFLLNKDTKTRSTWHKFKILNGSSCRKEVLLKTVMDCAEFFTPIVYKEEGPDFCFLAHNCNAAIERLVIRSGLVLEIPDGPRLQMQIILHYAPVSKQFINIQDTLVKATKKRYDANRKHLDLSNYHKDPDIRDLIYCPLSRQKILQYVLRSVLPWPLTKSIDLSNNEIDSVKALEQLSSYPSVTSLDLRHNKIAQMEDLKSLHSLKIQEVILDQNPLCLAYHDERSYINDVRAIFATIQKLDGVVLSPPGLPRFKRNFLMKPENYNLADQFVRHYFTMYDGESRRNLKGLYHRNALFSLTSTYLPGQSTSSNARLTEFTMESRNFLKLSDYAKNMKLLHHGPDDILAIICKLPRSEHDPLSFTVDLVESNYGIIITVCGVFREPAMMKSPPVRSFSRVFVLVQVEHRTFQIINEMIHIKNAKTEEVQAAFTRMESKSSAKNPVSPTESGSSLAIPTESDREQMVETLSKITEMNFKWSRKCLEESKWNKTNALTVFTELYKIGKIPPEAFSK